MSIFSTNPLSLQNFKLVGEDGYIDPTAMRVFQSEVGQMLYQLQQSISSASFLLSIITPLIVNVRDLGVITTDQTVAVGGSQFVFVRVASAVTQTRTVTLSALPTGAVVMIHENVTANTLTLKLAATDTASNPYTIQSWVSTTAAQTDMVGTGLAIGAASEGFFLGMSGFVGTSATPRLNLIFV